MLVRFARVPAHELRRKRALRIGGSGRLFREAGQDGIVFQQEGEIRHACRLLKTTKDVEIFRQVLRRGGVSRSAQLKQLGVSSMNRVTTIIAAAAATFVVAPAFAGPAAPAKPAPTTNSFSFEAGSEYAITGGTYKDFYIKPGIAHTFADGIIWGGSFQQVWIAPSQAKPAGSSEQQELLETTLGYNFKIDPTFTVTSSAGVGYFWDSNPGAAPAQNYGYYVLNAGLNAKLAPQLTWTVVSARWRDAFGGGWQTPKLSTTLSYAFTPVSSLYATYGYGWKNGAVDKYSFAGGFKLAF